MEMAFSEEKDLKGRMVHIFQLVAKVLLPWALNSVSNRIPQEYGNTANWSTSSTCKMGLPPSPHPSPLAELLLPSSSFLR
jgi:hypothetical protein